MTLLALQAGFVRWVEFNIKIWYGIRAQVGENYWYNDKKNKRCAWYKTYLSHVP